MVASESRPALKRFALETASAGGQETLRWYRNPLQVENKAAGSAFDPVTAADRACERVIRARIRAAYPHHAIHGEEYGEAGLSDWTWIVDPIDGTRAFMSGFLHWGVLLGLLFEGEPYLGVMAQPFTGETFFGDGASATYIHRGRTVSMRTRETKELADATFATTDPRLFESPYERGVLRRIEDSVRLVRYGADCYQYALIALGQLDLVVENVLQPWDIQPLAPIVRGAGGVVTNWQGTEDLTTGEVIAAANPILHERALARVHGA